MPNTERPAELADAGRLESALADRPGRVDLAARLPRPDADARRQLIRLYQGDLVLDLAAPEVLIERTEGVTELTRVLLGGEQPSTPGSQRPGTQPPAAG